MPDREKVINALWRCESYGYCEDMDCPYFESVRCLELLRKDALALLREHEPVQFKVTRQDKSYPFWDSVCTGCGYKTSTVKDFWKYCPVCGRKVKWE